LDKFAQVIIVGTGPSGIFAAFELVQSGVGSIAMFEKGKGLENRVCPLEAKAAHLCAKCSDCAVVQGWGGAGSFSDGKLTLSPEVGGHLSGYVGDELQALIDEVDQRYIQFGAPHDVYGTGDISDIADRAVAAGLRLIHSKIRHLGTGYSKEVLQRMYEFLTSHGVAVHFKSEVVSILTDDSGKVRGIKTAAGEEFGAEYVIVAPGRGSSEWLTQEAKRLGIPTEVNPVDLGVRVEVPAVVMRDITDRLYESKFVYYSKTFEDQVRTFCMCPNGKVTLENNSGLVTVNGHSHAYEKTENTNFALLVSKRFTKPFDDPIAYGKYVANLANLLGGGVLVQRLGDLLIGRRSTEDRLEKGTVKPTLRDATPGDLSLVLPYRIMTSILEMLEALDRICPGVYSRDTLLYGVEVKFYSSRLKLTEQLETTVRNLYAIGDGAGITRGVVQASVSGIVAARSILNRIGSRSAVGV
jgi:uncharacterized FAD-dependent dehydrogenase